MYHQSKKMVKVSSFKIIFIVFLVSFWSFVNAQTEKGSSEPKFGKKEIIEDLTYLKTSLIDAHYNLFAYTSKDVFLENYEKVKASIVSDSLNTLEVTSIFQKVIDNFSFRNSF